jgi:hypothetical protein
MNFKKIRCTIFMSYVLVVTVFARVSWLDCGLLSGFLVSLGVTSK